MMLKKCIVSLALCAALSTFVMAVGTFTPSSLAALVSAYGEKEALAILYHALTLLSAAMDWCAALIVAWCLMLLWRNELRACLQEISVCWPSIHFTSR